MSAPFKLLILLSYGKKEEMITLQERLELLAKSEKSVNFVCSDDHKIAKSGKALRKILQSFSTSPDLNERKKPFDPDSIERIFRQKDKQANVALVILTKRDMVVKIARKYLYDYFAREDEEVLSRVEPGQGLAIARNGTTWFFPYTHSRPRQHQE